VQAHFDRGVGLNLLGRRAEALAAFERVIELHPSHVQAMFDIGGIHRKNGDFDAALASYDRALAIQPRYTAALANKATTLHDMGRDPGAIAVADEVIRIVDADDAIDRTPEARATALGVKGAALFTLGRYAEALESFDVAIADGMDERFSHLNRAAALDALGRPAEADAARKLAEERPGTPS
jgi:tetratricopeptide (TPR) repeat protein